MDFSLQNAATVGVEEIVVVVSAFTEGVINHYGSSYRGIPITYKIQSEPKGVVHAIECAAGALDDSDFMLMLADEIVIDANHGVMIDRFQREELFAVLGVIVVLDRTQIGKTYSILEDSTSAWIYRLVEKPRRPHNDVMGTGNCVFKNAILSYLDLCPINQARGEKELPDLIQCAIDDGHPVKTHPVGTHYINVNASDDFRAAFDLLSAYAAKF
jgi:dTDP-glucose pyrophosphorylase